jgi:hypothetical protein
LITGIQPVPKPDVGSCTVQDSLATKRDLGSDLLNPSLPEGGNETPSGGRSATWSRTSRGRLSLRPRPHLRSEPELAASAAKVDNRTGHIRIPLLILANGVAMGETEDLRDAMGINQIL